MSKHRLKHVIPSYAVYMGLFIGTGFLSGAIVHLPLNPVRFAIIGLLGAVIFVASSTINEITIMKRQATHAEIAKLIVFSILLALGVGMISGGVQHFDEVPEYASKLIPIGVLLSLLGYVLKNGIDLHRRQTLKLAAAALAFVIVLGGVLGSYAQSYSQQPHGHDGETEQTADEPTGSNQDATEEQHAQPAVEEESSDGHAH
ncbi:hypothetical protein JNJ66_02130 [Candidatus Saccharibacteria bacterium]|nr:hypothetical protein [Candidatus Saccharibacteria bacterium]